jgi:hypothetical protein
MALTRSQYALRTLACVVAVVESSEISSFCWLMRLVFRDARVESILNPRSSGCVIDPVSPEDSCGFRKFVVDGLSSREFVQFSV